MRSFALLENISRWRPTLLEQTHKPSYSVLGAGTRDEPPRTSTWEATIVSATPRNNSLAVRKTVAELQSGLTEIVAVAGAQSLNHETDEKTVTVLPLTLYLLSFHYARVFDESLKCKLESKLERVLINSHLVKKLIAHP